ncbi:hypothetical protein [Novosphingobium malaysiense]|uniref:Uncharacterized protein n=1 Tax=Novosphingobium malaysiense TaxID=1348853 RepID=A0A0B1ZJN2_9SPHN|nr:hypothetical protein [Novosphingobium malaysiense]KHK89391.1 hypothetical protein LK12_19860 [Novosphingobium malaysiense]
MDENSGVLVGWTSQDLGSRLALKLETVRKTPPYDPEDLHTQFVFMDKNQAVQLGNYLFQVTGQTSPPTRIKSFFARIFS